MLVKSKTVFHISGLARAPSAGNLNQSRLILEHSNKCSYFQFKKQVYFCFTIKNMSELSEHDQAILNCVFNPNLPITPLQDAPTLQDYEILTPEVETTKKMELEAVQKAEMGDLDVALSILNQALEIAPLRASIYNNRAFVLQYQKKFTDASDDLTKAILLANPCREKKTLAHAYCQRGLLHKRVSRLDLAKSDFEASAKIGNQFAKSQLVELNPYAALCNDMLRKVMNTL